MPDNYFSKLHQAAIELARAGFPVFPCLPNDKAPALDGGFKNATDNEGIINGWWLQNPEYNIGWCPEDNGMCVVDIEIESIPDFDKLERENGGRIETFTNSTPRGGLHKYYVGSLPPTVKKAFNGYSIDTRGRGSYVLMPPSIVRYEDGHVGTYATVIDMDPAEVPTWVLTKIAEAAAKKLEASGAIEGLELDQPHMIRKAMTVLKKPLPGSGERNIKTFQMACDLKDLALSPQTVLDLIQTHWDTGLPFDELQTTVASAYVNSQNSVGAYAHGGLAETFGKAIANAPRIPDKAPSASYFHQEDEVEQDATPDIDWLYEGILPKQGIVLVYGASGAYKSFLLLDLALGIATGLKGWGEQAKHTGTVVYSALEGRSALKKVRRPAWRKKYGITGRVPFYVGRAPMLQSGEQQADYVAELDRLHAKLPLRAIFLETAAKMMAGLDATRDVPRFVMFCEGLADRYGCVVVVSHHAGHDIDRGPKDSSTYVQAFDTVIAVSTPWKKSELSVAQVTKHKDIEEPDQPFTFKGEKVVFGSDEKRDQSLVFLRTTPEEHANLTRKEDPLSKTKVGSALIKLKAIGEEHAVSTEVLALELCPMREDETSEDHTNRLGTTAKKLRRLCKPTFALEGYGFEVGKVIQWHMPQGA